MSQKRPGPAAPVPPPRPASRIIPPPPPTVHRLASIQPKTAPAPRLAPPPLPQRPSTAPAAGPPPPARPVLQPRILPVPAPPRPVPPPPPSRVVQGVIIDRKGGDELTDEEVDDLINLHGLKAGGAKYLRAVHKIDTRRVLATVLDTAVHKEQNPLPKTRKKPPTRGSRGFSKAGTDRTFKSVTHRSKTTFSGRWSSNITVSGTRSFSTERDVQVLRHISAQLFWYIRNELGHSSEQEVQSMFINGRILIAANEDESVSALAKDFKKKSKGHIRRIFEHLQEKDERSRANALKLAGLFSGTRVFAKIDAIDTLLEIVNNDSFVKLDISDAQGCKDAITKPEYRNKLVLTVGGGDLHAEQKLVLALYQSGSKGAIVYGKKRPCSACLATLKFANDKLKLGIRHNLHPGGYWGTANNGLVQLVNLAVERNVLTKKDAQEWLEAHTQGLQTYQSQPVMKGKRKKIPTKTVVFDPNRLVGESIYDSGSDSEGED